MIVKLTVADTDSGLRATLRELDDDRNPLDGRRARSFRVASVQEAKKRASSLARKHGLTTYRFLDKTKAKATVSA